MGGLPDRALLHMACKSERNRWRKLQRASRLSAALNGPRLQRETAAATATQARTRTAALASHTAPCRPVCPRALH